MADNQSASGDGSRQGSDPAGSNSEPSRPWRTEGVRPDSATGLPGGGGERRRWQWITFALLLLAVFGGSLLMQTLNGDRTVTISYTEFEKQVGAGHVKEIYAKGLAIEGTLTSAQQVPGKKDQTYTNFATERPVFAEDDLNKTLQAKGVTVRAEPFDQQSIWSVLLGTLLPVLFFVAIWILMLRWMRRRGGGLGGGMMNMGRNPKPVAQEEKRATFADVAGIDDVEAELYDIVDFLKAPGKYRRMGARAPRGVLLSGLPGTGKTLLARAVAGEADVPFFSAAASEFVEMVVGVGAARVRELFEEARKNAPAIIFIDEIDTIGRARGRSGLGGSDEREQTLNQILAEMDGFTGFEGVIVLAATNRPDVLDAALLRPGRFDRRIDVSPPDATGREQILAVHVREVPLATDVDLHEIALITPGMTGADLANLVNEAALLAVKRGRGDVGWAEFVDALEKIQLGTRRQLVMPETDRRRTAYHESGHALLGMLRPGADPVRKITIIPHGRALGVTVSTPDRDRYAYSEEYLRGRIVGALGGMAAEQVVFSEVTSGAESDLEQVTGIARAMIGRFGMSPEIGPLSALPADGDPTGISPAALGIIDAETRRIVDECYAEAIATLADNRPKLDALALALLEHETLNEADAYAAAGVERSSSRDDPPGVSSPGPDEG